MNNNITNTLTINIEDTEFDEENVGTVTLEVLNNLLIGLGINSIENGRSKIWVDFQQSQKIVLALKDAIEIISNKQSSAGSEEIKHIETFTVKGTNLNVNNDGIIIIEVYSNEKIGICVSLTKGADPELWLDVSSTKQVIDFFEITTKHIV